MALEITQIKLMSANAFFPASAAKRFVFENRLIPAPGETSPPRPAQDGDQLVLRLSTSGAPADDLVARPILTSRIHASTQPSLLFGREQPKRLQSKRMQAPSSPLRQLLPPAVPTPE